MAYVRPVKVRGEVSDYFRLKKWTFQWLSKSEEALGEVCRWLSHALAWMRLECSEGQVGFLGFSLRVMEFLKKLKEMSFNIRMS